jgi:phosphoribosyl 1,2-cyclic phosphodiesterase
MMEVCALFSGSSGNCIYIESGATAVLLDAGVSMKRIFAEIERIGKSIEKIKAVFVTHEHSDHINGLGPVARRLRVPVYATKKTWYAMYRALGKIEKDKIMPVEIGETIEIDGLAVTAFGIPHDAVQPCGYTFCSGRKKITVATDMGEVCDEVLKIMCGSDGVLLESNHDINMLMQGSYPYYLKQRIRGKNGHLSNDDAAAAAAKLAAEGTKTILLGHLSGENNTSEIALTTSFEAIEKTGVRDIRLEVIERGKEGKLIKI